MEERDPYQGDAQAANLDYCRKIAFSMTANQTPLTLLNWIRSEYGHLLNKLSVRPRPRASVFILS